MDFFEVIYKRRSVRKFKSEAVSEEIITKAIDAALVAPNSSNMQPWEFYWVRSSNKKAELAKACFGQGAATTASDLIVCVSRLDTWKKHTTFLLNEFEKSGKTPQSVFTYYKKLIPFVYTRDPIGVLAVLKKTIFSILGIFKPVPRGPATKAEMFEVVSKTTALACENLMLALTAQGAASCPMEGFDEARVKRILNISGTTRVVMILGVGYEDEGGVFGPQTRVPKDWVVHKI